MGTAAGWLPDPLGVHRVRYWDGTAWTHHVADDAQAFTDPARERRFYGGFQMVVGPLALAIWAYAAYFAVSVGPTSAAALVVAPGVLFAALLLVSPYVAVLDCDGNLTFRAVTRTISTTVDAVVRIGYTPIQGHGWRFDFGTGRASLGSFGSDQLTEYLVARRPELARTASSWRGW